MLDIDDSFINEYIAESREHLADIETDLLAIEESGKAINEQLVNKVFRAAHSIKGGAGFFDLNRIQELAHRTENVLDLIRSREMVPTPDVVNILLAAFDRLREMINNHSESQQVDNSELVVALSGLITAHLPVSKKESLTKMVKVTAPGVKAVLNIPEFDFNRAKEGGRYIYLVEYDLIDDVQRQGKRPLEVIFILNSCGTVVEAVFDLDEAGTLDDEPSSRLPLDILFATELGPENADVIFGIPPDQIHLIFSPGPLEEAPALRQELTAPTSPASARLVSEPAVAPEPAPQPEPEPVPLAAASPAVRQTSAPAETTLRVEIGLLDTLMNLAGELVLSRNQLIEAMAGGDKRSIQTGVQRINVVTSELQETIMLTRMQPIGNVFNKFPRLVRDLSKELGKEVHLEISGREVEMDKTIIEGLSEPLTHMVRNAVDHGIESPQVRNQAGKTSAGTVHLKAFHEAGQVVVEISDDGSGIDPQKVATSALEKGLITSEQFRAMSEKEMTALIFLPGLSTAKKVSDVSGRGVGMDVVKTNLDRLGGKIEIDTHLGGGTNFIIKLPLTLAIIPSLLVSISDERFAIPQVHISELIYVPPEQIRKRIEVVGNAEVLVLRGTLIPLVHLSEVLEIDRVYQDSQSGETLPERRKLIADRRSRKFSLIEDQEAAEAQDQNSQSGNRRATTDRRSSLDSGLNIVVMTSGTLQYGLIVDQMHDTIEIVVKPLGRQLKGLREYAGATILGDGRVALILDAAGIAAKQQLISMAGSRRAKELNAQTQRELEETNSSFLTFRNSPQEFCAVPLDLVERISEVENSQVEWIGGRRTLQYRGVSLPLVTLKDTARVDELLPEQPKVVLIFNFEGHLFGLLAGLPVDVIETEALIDYDTLRQPGVLGSAILDGHTTLIIDISGLVQATHPEWLAARENPKEISPNEASVVPAAAAAQSATDLILLAEDSDFFRGQVKRFIESGGYKVLAAEDGQAAWELLQQNADGVKLVVTDIEMPHLDGLGLARAIRSDGRFDSLPIIALTSLASDEDMARGKEAGVNDYQIKLDREKLLNGIAALLAKLKPELSGDEA